MTRSWPHAKSPLQIAWLAGILAAAAASCSPAPAPPSWGTDPAGSGSAAVTPAPTTTTPTAPPPTPIERRMPAGEPEGDAVALGVNGAIASQEAHATDVGLQILRDGGNAIDASVAVGFALAVTHPSAGNIGGGGFLVIRLADGTTRAIDYREKAPSAATSDMYLDAQGKPTDESLIGPKAAGIPGTVAGLLMAHEEFGSLPLEKVLAPAVQLAREGHALNAHQVEDLARGVERGEKAGFAYTASLYRKADGSAYAVGDVWKQPELADVIDRIAREGERGFYEGPVAQAMVEKVRAAGGIWQLSDLASYDAVVREPIEFDYRGHRIITMPPPSAGGVVLKQLLIARESRQAEKLEWLSPAEIHFNVEASRRAYADRNSLLGDPDYVDMPLSELLDPTYIQGRMQTISLDRATPSSELGAGAEPPKESEQTTHYSTIDRWGNAVSNTTTLNTGFGSRFAVEGTGILLNNEMDDFSAKPGSPNVFGLIQGEANKVEPNKRMLSSMTPTIVVHDGDVRAVVGSPGGPTITNTVFQVIRSLVDYGKPMQDAVRAPRAHHQFLPDRIFLEDRADAEVQAGLKALGHELNVRRSMGHANCIEVDPETHGFRAVADVERDGGKAAAY